MPRGDAPTYQGFVNIRWPGDIRGNTGIHAPRRFEAWDAANIQRSNGVAIRSGVPKKND
jgi:hypothetical protein